MINEQITCKQLARKYEKMAQKEKRNFQKQNDSVVIILDVNEALLLNFIEWWKEKFS